jgi:hypothetical protein
MQPSEMQPWHGELHADLDELTAFDAMRRFLENWWKRSGSPDRTVFEEGDVLWLLSACDRDTRANGMPTDRAMWADWQQAIADVKSRTEREGISSQT